MEESPPSPPSRYRWPRLDHVEDVERYVPGGYHPVDLNDVIANGDRKYAIVAKLGHGGFATVWLVRSSRGDSNPAYFALKILCADIADDDELAILQHLQTASTGHPNIIELYDSFKISGPNGEHQCLVFPVLGPSLGDITDANILSGPIRYQVCQQMASAISFLHKNGICHGGMLYFADLSE
jgi:serine/threonine protein kinase